jgi:hypothetical protein
MQKPYATDACSPSGLSPKLPNVSSHIKILIAVANATCKDSRLSTCRRRMWWVLSSPAANQKPLIVLKCRRSTKTIDLERADPN